MNDGDHEPGNAGPPRPSGTAAWHGDLPDAARRTRNSGRFWHLPSAGRSLPLAHRDRSYLLAVGLWWYWSKMRTAAEFNQFYAFPDPWRISRASFRDKVLRRCVSKHVAGRSVLELGCGEGHLTQSIFNVARSVKGIDISDVAIERAKARNLANAHFEDSDFLRTSFAGFDVIAALECIYYLTPDDQEAFFDKVAREHRGLLIFSSPIIGKNEHRKYFTHEALMETFARHRLSVIKFHNLNIYRGYAAKILTRLCSRLLDYMPTQMIYQRCYITRMM